MSWGNKFCQSCGAPLLLNNRYVPLKQLGAGGFAVTYTVYDLRSQTERVLKVLVVSSPQALRLFEQEAAVLASLHHPGVPGVEPDSYFLVQLDNPKRRTLPCLVMEKIHGQTLEAILDQYPKGCPESLVLDWLIQAVEILRQLHSRQIIHRDLKPANFMLRTLPNIGLMGGQLVAIDFGGAKQIKAAGARLKSASGKSSTRLISPGYSPPEQIAGSEVGPAADFYALGRTFIHLLTGRYPAELDDPFSGECLWHPHAKVSPVLRSLLDEMVSASVRQRPSSAAEIQGRLLKIARLYRRRRLIFTKATAIALPMRSLLKPAVITVWGAIASVTVFAYRAIARTLQTSFSLISWVVRASSDTLLGMVLGGFGGILGAGIGFWLVYGLPIGTHFSAFLSQQLTRMIPNAQLTVDPVVLLFCLAGLGTAWGLTEAGSFGQLRRFWIAGLMGSWGYVLGWLNFQMLLPTSFVSAGQGTQKLVEFAAIAIAFLTLGLGLPRPHLLHTAVTAIGTAALLATLVYLSPSLFFLNFFPTTGDWPHFFASTIFFGLLGSTSAFCLGASYYFLIPFLRFLGFR